MGVRTNLSENEHLVLYGLCRHPRVGDAELSKLIGVKRSTVTAARNRLHKGGYYQMIYAPNFTGIGCELLTVIHGDFNPSTPYSVRKKYLPSQRFEQIFFVATSDLQHVSMSAAKNLTETQKYEEFMDSVYSGHNFMQPHGNEHAYFPMELSTLDCFFDYSGVLRKHFKIELDDLSIKDYLAVDQFEFKEIEAKVLHALVENPHASDAVAAEISGLSRQSVNAIRQTLLKKDLIHPLVLPNLEKIGLQFLVFRHINLMSGQKNMGEIVSNPYTIFSVSNSTMNASLSVYVDYNEYEEHERQIRNRVKDKIKSKPKTRIFSTKDLHLTPGKYAPLVRKMMGLQ